MILRIVLTMVLCSLPFVLAADDRKWTSLKNDGKHAEDNPGLEYLQNPEEVLRKLPPDFLGTGNQVDWVRALNSGIISPRTQLYESTQINVIDMDIIMNETAGMPYVRFPHKAHTEWLDCTNCHPKLFEMKAGATPVNMFAILAGEYCGRCHGAVAFPLTECRRCHSVVKDKFKGKPGAQPGPGKVYPPVVKQ